MDNPKHIADVEAAFKNYTQVNHTIVKHFGDANPAFILGYIISEAKFLRAVQKLDAQGYFWCKKDKLEEKFGMSGKVQDTIVKKLEKFNLISVITKTVQGSANPAQIRHFKVNYTEVYNLVNGIIAAAKPVEVETLPDDLAAIKAILKDFVESKGAKFYTTTDDETVLRIARNIGFTKELSLPLLAERIKKWKHKEYNCKYLVTSLMTNFKEVHTYITTPKPKPELNLFVA